MSQNANGNRSITQIIDEGVDVEKALDRAFYRAVLLHRQANVPMSFTDEQGKPYTQDAHDIPIPEEFANLEPFRY